MSKTPEQYVEYALKHFSEHHKTAGRIVQELRAAGWLREANEIPALVALEGYKRLLAEKERELCPGCYDRVTELTRERDEARTNAAQAVGQLDLAQRERDEARVDREAWARAYRRALATAASPEVMRVLERAEACHRRWRLRPPGSPEALALFAAVDALSASRQPKAQEPRYEVVRRKDDALPWAVGDNEGGWASTHRFQAGAEAECARLNGEAK